MPTTNTTDCYKTLGLEPGASPADVKRAYRRLAKTWHPDRFTHAPHLQQHAMEQFQTINHAYTMLQRQHTGTQTPPAPTPAEPSAGSARTAARATHRPAGRQLLPPWLIALLAFLALRLWMAYVIPLWPCPRPHGTVAPRLVFSPEDSSPPHQQAPQPALAPGSERPADTSAAPVSEPRTFTVGSTKAEVHAIQGSPTGGSPHVWEYGGSRVYFREDRVTRWEEWPRSPLKARLRPTAPVQPTRDYFTIGDTKDEVLLIQGSPTRFSEHVWEYGHARVYFENNRVIRWDAWRSSPLKARHHRPDEGLVPF